MGIDVLTSGNHIWDQKDIIPYLDQEPRILRPANYPPGTPGNFLYYATINDQKVAIINLIGRVFMGDFDCPFRKIDQLLEEVQQHTPFVIIDFHAEATQRSKLFLGMLMVELVLLLEHIHMFQLLINGFYLVVLPILLI